MTAIAACRRFHRVFAHLGLSTKLVFVALCVPIHSAQGLTTTFTNPDGISILSTNYAVPFPSSIFISGITGTVNAIRVKLNGVTHTWPDDVDMFLVAPNKEVCILWSDAGGSDDIINGSFVFQDSAASDLPDFTQISPGTYRPTSYELGDDGSLPPFLGSRGTSLAALTAGGVNGEWRLYILDDALGDSGSIVSWSIEVDSTPDLIGPTGGSISTAPVSPVDAGTSVTVSFAGWIDPTPPLTYAVLFDDVVVSGQNTSVSRILTSPTTPGLHTVKGRIYDGVNNFTEVAVPLAVNTALESWRKLHFSTLLNSGDASDTFDFDHDGLVNLVEFAFGLNPKLGSSNVVPQGSIIAENYIIGFATPSGVSGISYGAEWSTTLISGSWQTIPDTGVAPQHIFSVPVGGNTKVFIRLKVTSP